MKSNTDIYSERLNGYLQLVEQNLLKYLPSPTDDNIPLKGLQSTVIQAMIYACSSGGKRIRPVLLLEWCNMCGGDVESAVPFACAIEMIHCYSLVHDDLPCMDNSTLRRGKPSTFAKFGEDMALLAGDALLNMAFEIMLESNHPKVSSNQIIKAASCLGRASGIYGMVGGQTIDLQSENKSISIETLEQLQLGKTAALIIASCEMGAILANASNEEILAAREFGQQLGLGFQIVDDILDVTSTYQQLGKPTGSDMDNKKTTYVTEFGIEKAKQLAKQRTDNAINALGIFGEKANDLCKMTEMFYNRKR